MATKAQNQFDRVMAKKNRIGKNQYTATTTKRMSTTPPDGVYVFDEDLNQLFIGDGASVGGVAAGASRGYIEIFDDFLGQTLVETDGPWIENAGSGGGTDPAYASTQVSGGIVQLVTGSGGATAVGEGSQIVCDIPVQADSGGITFETRLHIAANVGSSCVFAGFTDSQTLENIASAGANGTGTTFVASDACGFLFDPGRYYAAASAFWHCVAIDSDYIASGTGGSGATSTSPTAGVYQILRVDVSSDGNTVTYYINDSEVDKITNGGITPSVSLYGTVCHSPSVSHGGAAADTVNVDYIYIGQARA